MFKLTTTKMLKFFEQNMVSLLSSLFASGALYRSWLDRRRLTAEAQQAGGNALEVMQKVYDTFAADFSNKYLELKKEVEYLKNIINTLTTQLSTERSKHEELKRNYFLLKKDYEQVKKLYASLKRQVDGQIKNN